jgi:nitrite reductase/ring-hydroxylating ferredoxin subunit/uncharacterized membrane protein
VPLGDEPGEEPRVLKVIEDIEGNAGLDRLSQPLVGFVNRLTSTTLVKNALSGTWLGHQLHPMLTDVPIGAWSMAAVLDLTSGAAGAASAQRLVGFGVLSSVPAAATGASDWADTYGPEQRVGVIHAASNVTALVLQTSSWLARRRGRRTTAILLSGAGLAAVGVGGYLGGHLSYARGVGVNHTAFEDSVGDWTDVAAEADLVDGTPMRVEASGVPVVLVRRGGTVHALSAVCTHAGGPLDEGSLTADGCIRCPWHGSEFRLEDGTVARGPASVPEPAWEVQVRDGRVSVRSA